MRIQKILERTISIGSEMKNAYIDFSEMTVSLIAIVSDIIREGKPVTGYGFNSNGRYAQGGILRERLIPRIMKAAPEEMLTSDGRNVDPMKAWRVMMKNEKPGGHGDRSVAVGVADMALWDLAAKIEQRPLYQLLADRFNGGRASRNVPVYAAGGYYYPDGNLAALTDEMKRYVEMGYTMVKMKIGGAALDEDLRRVEAVLNTIGTQIALAVDANGRFGPDTGIRYLKALSAYPIRWYEEPCDPLDFLTLSKISASAQIPIATGENLFSHQEVMNLLRYGGLSRARDILQMDPALSYGLPDYIESLSILREMGWSPSQCIPHGGHQMALHAAAGLGLGGNESYPGVFQPIGGFADGVAVVEGRIEIPDTPGIGIELKQNLFAEFKRLA